MVVDSSVLVAIVLGEEGYEAPWKRLAGEPGAIAGAPTLLEASIVLRSRLGAQSRALFDTVLTDLEIRAVPFEPRHLPVALDAFTRFGKGRHAASLNYGDCMTYAIAQVAREPLLCLGDDFARTDLALA